MHVTLSLMSRKDHSFDVKTLRCFVAVLWLTLPLCRQSPWLLATTDDRDPAQQDLQ